MFRECKREAMGEQAKEQKLPKYAKAGIEVEALWEGKWWKATVLSTKRNKWLAEVEWREEGGTNEVSLDDVRPISADSPVDAAAAKKKSKEELRKQNQKEKEKKERETEKAVERRAKEGMRREVDEKKSSEERKGRAREEESRAAVMQQVEGMVRLVAGLVCIPVAILFLLVSIVALSGAAILGSVTWLLPSLLVLAPLTYLLKGGEDKFSAASVLKTAIDADYGIAEKPSPTHNEKAGAVAGGAKKKTGKEKKVAAAERQQEEMEAQKKQTQTVVRLCGITCLVIGLVVGVSLLDLRKEAKGPDLYGLLGVDLDAGEQAIMASYKKLSRAWHPDKYQGEAQEEAKAKMILLNEAKATLLDATKREQYNTMRDHTSKLGYEEPTLTYATKHHWLLEAYLSCPQVFKGAKGALVCSAFPLSHIVWHPILAYAFFSWAHFGDVSLARRRGANAACLTGILFAAASLASGGFLLSAFPTTIPVVSMVVCCLPVAYMVDFLLIRRDVTETKTFTGVGRPIIKTETNLVRPAWLPSLVSYETLMPVLSSYFKMLQQDVEHVECVDGEQRLVGTARMGELKDIPKGYLK